MFQSLRICTFLLLAALSIGIQSKAGKKLKVLFIGNSYTYTNNLPQIIGSMAASMGDTLIFDSYTIGGYRFADHAFDTLCAKKIKSAKWDCIILQEQSRTPSMQDGYFFTNSYHYARSLDTMIQSNDPCTERMFYMTWGYKNGDSVFCAAYPTWPYFCTYQGMDSLINLRYRAYADTALPAMMGYTLVPGSWFSPIRPAQVSPVGEVWHYIRDDYPSIELYQPDESHPSEAGSYAAACTFYAALFRRDPILSTYNYNLTAAVANNIKLAAKLVVYDSLMKWNIGKELRAEFTPTMPGGNLVIFLNTSTPIAATYQWAFGDGTTGAGATVFHTYAGPGTYSLRLIATNGGCSDTTYDVVNLFSTGVASVTDSELPFIVSPNPAANLLTIRAVQQTASFDVTIINALGQIVYIKNAIQRESHLIDISSYSSGAYIISIAANGRSAYRTRFVKHK